MFSKQHDPAQSRSLCWILLPVGFLSDILGSELIDFLPIYVTVAIEIAGAFQSLQQKGGENPVLLVLPFLSCLASAARGENHSASAGIRHSGEEFVGHRRSPRHIRIETCASSRGSTKATVNDDGDTLGTKPLHDA